MDRMAKLGLTVGPTLAPKVLSNFRLGAVTDYEQILTNSNKKVKHWRRRSHSTVETSRLAPLTVDWPPQIAMYYLPYKRGKLKKIDLFSGTCSQLLRGLQ